MKRTVQEASDVVAKSSPKTSKSKRKRPRKSRQKTRPVRRVDDTDSEPETIQTLGLASTQLSADAEEEKLAKAVLGGENFVLDSLLEKHQNDSSEDEEYPELEAIVSQVVGVLDKEKKKPAWEDDDDESISVSQEAKGHHSAVWKTNDTQLKGKDLKKRLQSQFEKTIGSAPSWATLKSEKKKKKKGRRSDEDDEEDGDEDDDEDDENRFLRRTGDYLTTSHRLPKTNLDYQKVKDANKERPTQARISSVQFHPTSQVLLAAGLDNNLNLFQVDGKLNPLIQTVHLERFPITRAQFSSDGMEVVMTSRYRYFHVFDMMAGHITKIPNIKGTTEQRMMKFQVSPDGRFIVFVGNYGYMYLLSGKNKELIDTLKMNGTVSSMCFTPDGSQLLSFGDDGEVYVWDLSTRECVHKFIDEGCMKGTSVAVSRNNQYIACGCDSGVVNIYDQSCLSQANPKPLKSIMNLVTSIGSIRFNHTNELMAIGSRFTQKACRMVHLPSYQVFPNFPSLHEQIGCVDSIDFSPHSGYMTLGNSKGQALLYRLKHFADY